MKKYVTLGFSLMALSCASDRNTSRVDYNAVRSRAAVAFDEMERNDSTRRSAHDELEKFLSEARKDNDGICWRYVFWPVKKIDGCREKSDKRDFPPRYVQP